LLNLLIIRVLNQAINKVHIQLLRVKKNLKNHIEAIYGVA